MTRTILVTDHMFDDLQVETELAASADVSVVERPALTPDEVSAAIEETGADVVAVTFAEVSRSVLDAAENLKAVGRYGIGFDTVDIQAATSNDVIVVNVPSYSVDEVSTHAFALLLSCARSTVVFDRDIKGGGWDWQVGAPIPRLSESTLGLIGFGEISRRVAEKAVGFGFEILAYDPYVAEEDMTGYDVAKVELMDLLQRADYISVHTPLNEETYHLLGADEFRMMKDTAVIINTARGAVVNVDELNEALDAGEVARAGLDVLPTEPPATEDMIIAREDVVVTPHAAWYSEASIIELRTTLFTDLIRILDGEAPINPVNPEHVGS